MTQASLTIEGKRSGGFFGRLKPRFLVILLGVSAVLAVGAGAAAGTVLRGDIEASVPLTVSQALLADKPQPINFPAGRGFFGSTSDDQSKFSLAIEMYRGETLSVLVPIVNRSSGDAVADFSITVPDIPTVVDGIPGLVIEVTGSGVIDDVIKISPDTWTFTADGDASGLASNPDDGLIMTFKVATTAMSGYFEITGRVRTVEY